MNDKIDTIIAYVCHAFMVGRADMLSRNRTDRVSRARHAFCKIMADFYGMHDQDIAGLLKRHRSTSDYCRKAAQDLLDTDKHFLLAYNQAADLIKNNPHLAAQ